MRRFSIDGSFMSETPEGPWCQNINDTSALTCRLSKPQPPTSTAVRFSTAVFLMFPFSWWMTTLHCATGSLRFDTM